MFSIYIYIICKCIFKHIYIYVFWVGILYHASLYKIDVCIQHQEVSFKKSELLSSCGSLKRHHAMPPWDLCFQVTLFPLTSLPFNGNVTWLPAKKERDGRYLVVLEGFGWFLMSE